MKIFKGLLIAISWLLQSCFDSDEHIFNETEAVEISIDVTLSKSMSVPTPSIKADTFNIGDTIYFLTNITPNKIIRVQDYQWLMDGEHCSSEYNFKKQITKPGHHKFTFELKDYFGDMHYDSLEIWVAGNPTLNDSSFIPAMGTQAIDPYEAIYFTWSSSTEGIKLGHRYRFTLSEQSYANTKSNFKDIDTVLSEPHFTFHNKLNPLKKYNWTVQSFNEYNFASTEKIESTFYTKGLPKEGSLSATIELSQESQVPIKVSVQNKDNIQNIVHYNFTPSKTYNEISLGAIPAGQYTLYVQPDYPDFKPVTIDAVINDGFVTVIDEIKLTDSIKPTITSISGLDTLNFADTLQFIVNDGSGSQPAQNISAKLESEEVTNKFYKDSILYVILSNDKKSWTYRILTIFATDNSGNKSSKSFYIKPSTTWFRSNDDTTVKSDDTILFFIYDMNSFGFKVDSLKFFNVTQNTPIISIKNTGSNSFTAELEASLFEEKQTIRSTVVYTNGLVQNKEWVLHVKKATTEDEQ